MKEALALIPATFPRASVSFTREGGRDVSDVTAVSDRIEGAIDTLKSKGCADGLVAAAHHVALKPDIVKFLILEASGSRPKIEAIRAKIGEPDRTETTKQMLLNEYPFSQFNREAEKKVVYHIYDWIHFGAVDGTVRVLRVDCARLPKASSE